MQETAYFSTGMNEVTAAPFAIVIAVVVWIFIECRSVISCQSIAIYSEMHRNKVHDDTDSAAVAEVNELFQAVHIAIASSWTIKACILIAP